LVRKLIHRHPHVFGDVTVVDASEVLVNWEQLKADEVGRRKGVDEDIPASLPALARASKAQRRAAGWGFEWRSVEGAVAALREEVDELAGATSPENAEEEVGDVLFATVAVARKHGVDPESALRRTIRGFARRYERFVALAAERGIDVETAPEADLRALFREAR
jgi:MazG family protein